MPLSPALKEIYASPTSTSKFIETLEFRHSKFTGTPGRPEDKPNGIVGVPADNAHFFVNEYDDYEFRIDKNSTEIRIFLSLPFIVGLPKQDDGGVQEFTATLANVGREMMAELEAAVVDTQEPIVCIYRVYQDIPHALPRS